jgi:hypothetical protein
MLGVGIEEDDAASIADRLGPAVVDVGRRVEPDARMTVIVVVPTEESSTVGAAVLEAAEPVRELRSIFEGAELAFGIRIVVRYVRPAV